MTYVLLVLLVLALRWIWEIRKAVQRPSPSPVPGPVTDAPAGFTGAVPPERYVVMRWPSGQKHYGGCIGAQAREVFEHNHPGTGEAVELWELGTCRGRKAR